MPITYSELIADNFVFPKFFIFFSVALFLCASSLFIRHIEEFKINSKIFYLTICCIFIYFISQFFYFGGSYRVISFEFLCLIVILLFSSFLKSREHNFLSIIARFNLGSLVIIVTTILINIAIKNEASLDLFFGNRNHLAEFLGASILFQVFMFFQKKKSLKYYNLILWYSVIAGFFICLQTLCRSVLLSLLICIVILFLEMLFKNRNKIKRLYFVYLILFISIASVYGYKTYLSSSSEIAAIKTATSNLRLIRWKNTLEMIKDHPLGVGPGNYEFAYIGYKDKKANDFELTEKTLIKSPHNGYLELFSEYGIVLGLFYLMLIFFLFLEFWKIEFSLYFYFLLFFCINAIFSFPIELPFSSYFIAIVIGIGVSEIKPRIADFKINLFRISKYLFILVFIGYMVIVPSLISSILTENKFQSAIFCKLTPSIWRNCIDASVKKISEGDFNGAAEVLSEHLKFYPNNFIALRYYAFSLAKLGKTEAACISLKKYNDLFLGNSSIKDIMLKQCSL